MKKLMIFLSIIASFALTAQQIPFNQLPDWQSTPSGHVATGLGLADINGDGWKDIIAANGNDMARQHLVVYYNQGDGTFPLLPDWQSEDIDYHGHLSAGDINRDGYNDVAVSVYIGAGGFNFPGKVKVYYNQGGELEATPSFGSFQFYTFSCALGDADSDGDLDLAVACSEPYSQEYDHGRIFYNEGGYFSNTNYWESSIQMGGMDVDFADMDRNGYLDVIYACEYTDNYIYLADDNGTIPSQPSWYSSESDNFINSFYVGLMPGDALPSLVMTGNDQLGGDGKVRLYKFDLPFPNTNSASWLSNTFGYGSGVLLSDVTNDGNLDLIYGGWWKPVQIHTGNGEDFQLLPSYISSTNSVVEAIQMADLGRESVIFTSETFYFVALTSLVTLSEQLIEDVTAIYKNGILLGLQEYCYLPNKNWISFSEPLIAGDEVIVHYEYSIHGDIVITNWDSGKGNYIFYNTNPPVYIPEVSCHHNPAGIEILQDLEGQMLEIVILYDECGPLNFQIMNIAGQVVKEYYFSGKSVTSSKSLKISFSGHSPGIYFIRCVGEGFADSKKVFMR